MPKRPGSEVGWSRIPLALGKDIGRFSPEHQGPKEFLIRFAKASNVMYEQSDFAARKLFSKSRHAAFAMPDNGLQSSAAGNGRMFLPPLGISKVRCIVGVAKRRVPSTVRAMTARAVRAKEIVNTRSARLRFCRPALCGRRSSNQFSYKKCGQ